MNRANELNELLNETKELMESLTYLIEEGATNRTRVGLNGPTSPEAKEVFSHFVDQLNVSAIRGIIIIGGVQFTPAQVVAGLNALARGIKNIFSS